MVRHYRSVHSGIKYPCKSRQTYIQSKHEGIKYPCDQCDYQASYKTNLRDHIAAKHSDNILKCDHCDYQTKWRQSYYSHLKTTHKIVWEFVCRYSNSENYNFFYFLTNKFCYSFATPTLVVILFCFIIIIKCDHHYNLIEKNIYSSKIFPDIDWCSLESLYVIYFL